MMFSSFTIVMASAFLVAAVGILYVQKTHRNALRRREIRRQLLKKVESLPLPRMMKALGIGIRRFFHELPVETIEESIALCETCTSKTQCAEKLRMPELNPEDVEFCKNQQHLSGFSRSERLKQQNQR